MGKFKRFLQRINPFDGMTYAQWDRKYLANFYAGSKIYEYKGGKYMIRPNSWTEPFFLVGQNLNISIGKALTLRDITDAYTVLFSTSLDIQYSDKDIKIIAGWVGAVEKYFILTPNYYRPDLTLQYWGEFLGIPQSTLIAIIGYSVGREGDKQWLNGTLYLMTANHIGIQNYLFDIESSLEFIAKGQTVTISNLGQINQPDPAINPLTGQPYGFGSADLETGEITQDGVIIKAGTTNVQIKRVEPTTTSKNNGLKTLVALALGVVIYKRIKNKKR